MDVTSLSEIIKIIEISFDNSMYIIDEKGRPDSFCIINNLKNTAIPCNQNKYLSPMEQFSKANYTYIYQTYIKLESFEEMLVFTKLIKSTI